MATQTMKMVIQLRRDTSVNWELHKDIVPAAGEPCFVTDKNILKIGDGVTDFEHLEPIGGTNIVVSADGKSIVLNDGVFKLMGFDAAEVGAQPRKAADGTIEWVMPADISTLEADVKELKSNVTNLQTSVTTLQEIVTPSGEDDVPLLSRVETLEEQMNGKAEGSVDAKIDTKINEFANEISDDGTVNTLKELVDYVANHGGELATIVADVTNLQSLVGDDPVSEQISAAINESGHITKTEAESTFVSKADATETLLGKVEAAATLKHVKYELAYKPTGTLVDYRDKEVRIMCPADTKWVLQNSGENADKSKYYVGFKAYAPEGAASFKEDLAEIIADDTMYYFEDNEFAGVDEYGRKYSIVWLPAAAYDSEADTWTYYGEKSSAAKYIGWHYSVEWYDKNGNKIDADCIRINLSNEDCHTAINTIKGVKVNGTLLDAVDGIVDISIAEQTLGVKSSDEIDVAEDGTLSIKSISFDKIVQDEESVIFMDGGNAI